MNNAKRTQVSRDSIVELLTDDEVAKVSTAETGARLAEGDEFIDLEKLDQGVRHANGVLVQLKNIVPRKAVHEKT